MKPVDQLQACNQADLIVDASLEDMKYLERYVLTLCGIRNSTLIAKGVQHSAEQRQLLRIGYGGKRHPPPALGQVETWPGWHPASYTRRPIASAASVSCMQEIQRSQSRTKVLACPHDRSRGGVEIRCFVPAEGDPAIGVHQNRARAFRCPGVLFRAADFLMRGCRATLRRSAVRSPGPKSSAATYSRLALC